MKILYKILIAVLFIFTVKVSGQLDTLNYLKQFEANKINYINQPFSKLLNEMTQIQPETAWSYNGHKNKNIVFATLFSFCEMDESFSNAITLAIEWQDPIPVSDTDYYENKNGFYFTNEEKVFYGSKIVKNIRVYR